MVEEKIYSYLVQNPNVGKLLTTYNGLPAVFLQEAPSDTDKNWADNQYGRLIFGVDYVENAERAISATLWVDIFSSKTGPQPEETADIVKRELDKRFFSDGAEVVALDWNATNGFQETFGDKLVNGVTLTFDVLFFPSQLTTQPDPIEAMNRWTKEKLPNAFVMGVDDLPDTWTPNSETPTVYWRVANIRDGSLYPNTYHCTWHDADLTGHFMMDDTTARQTVCKSIVDALTTAGTVMLLDGSPLFVLRTAFTAGADAVEAGQVTVTASYGVLRSYGHAPVLNVAHKTNIFEYTHRN